MVHYAKSLASMPPDTRFPNIEEDGVRLGLWTLLCKLGSILLTHRLRHEGVGVAAETLEQIMMGEAADNNNKAIVSHLATHARAHVFLASFLFSSNSFDKIFIFLILKIC